MLGFSLGMVVESSVAVLLAVTIGYCMVLNRRLKRLHGDREALGKMVADLVQATTLANAAVGELKRAALDSDQQLKDRIGQAEKLELSLTAHMTNGGQLMEKIARITAAAKPQSTIEARAEVIRNETPAASPAPAARVSEAIEPQNRLQSALQQLAMRPNIGGRAA